MNIDCIGEAVASFAACHLSWKSQPKSVTVTKTSFWLWLRNPATAPTIICALLVLSSGNWKSVVIENFFSLPKIFVYSWSLPRKFRNRVVHAMNGNPTSGKRNMNIRTRKSKCVSWFGRNLIADFSLTILLWWIAMFITFTRFLFCSLYLRSGAFFFGISS